MATTIGNLRLLISASTAGLGSSLASGAGMISDFASKATSQLKSIAGGGGLTVLAKSLPVVGAAAGMVIGQLEKLMDKTMELRKAGMKLGADASTMSVLKFAARDDFDALVHGMTKFREKLGEALIGSKEMALEFKTLGLDADKLGSTGLTGQLDMLIDRYKNLGSETDKAYFMHKLFGKAGMELIPIFEKMKIGMALTTEEAKRLGQYIGPEQANAMIEAKKNMKEFNDSIDGVWNSIALKLTPAIAGLNTALDRKRSTKDRLGGFLEAATFGVFTALLKSEKKAVEEKNVVNEKSLVIAAERVKLEEKYAAILNGLQSPLEKHRATVEEIGRLWQLSGNKDLFQKSIRHAAEELLKFHRLMEDETPLQKLMKAQRAIEEMMGKSITPKDGAFANELAKKNFIKDLGIAARELTPIQKYKEEIGKLGLALKFAGSQMPQGLFDEMRGKAKANLLEQLGFGESGQKSRMDVYLAQIAKLGELWENKIVRNVQEYNNLSAGAFDKFTASFGLLQEKSPFEKYAADIQEMQDAINFFANDLARVAVLEGMMAQRTANFLKDNPAQAIIRHAPDLDLRGSVGEYSHLLALDQRAGASGDKKDDMKRLADLAEEDQKRRIEDNRNLAEIRKSIRDGTVMRVIGINK